MKGKGWLKTQHPRTTSSMQSSRFPGQISASIYLKVTRISLYLETTNQFQKIQHIIKNAYGIPLRALQRNTERQFSHDDIAFPNINKQRRHLVIFYTKQHLQMLFNCSQKNNSN